MDTLERDCRFHGHEVTVAGEEGREEERVAIARKMLAAGIDIDLVMHTTGLPRERLPLDGR